MSSNNRDGDQFNDNVKHKCHVCGCLTSRPLFKSGEAMFCTFKCYDEYREVSNSLADMSTLSADDLIKAMEFFLKEREQLLKDMERL